MRSTHKRAACPGCCPDIKAAYFEASWNFSEEGHPPTWRCNNCNYEMPRREMRRLTHRTRSQEKALERLPDAIFRAHAYGDSSKYEVKKHEVEDSGHGTIFLTFEMGRIGDEGTLAEAFARDHRHIAIGRRGGLELLNAKRKGESKGWFNAVHGLVN